MIARNLTGLLWIVAIFYPMTVMCQSRGETGVRGPLVLNTLKKVIKDRQRSPYQYQSQSQSHLLPPPPFIQQQTSQHEVPSPYVAPLTPFPIAPPPNPERFFENDQIQQNSNLDSRYEDRPPPPPSTGVSDGFSTRPPRPTRRPITTHRPPTLLDTRFDDRGSAAFRKKLTFDPQISQSMETFALELLPYLSVQLSTTNFMISPFSIYNLLVLIAEGSRGSTYQELNTKLNLIDLPRTRDFQQYLSVALKQNTADVVLQKFSMLVIDQNRPINPDYENLIEKVYDADVEPVNFSDVDFTTNKINALISNLTRGLITETVIRDDLFKAQLLLLSGLYFQGKWMDVFNTSFTKREPFYDTNGNQIGFVNMMFQRGPIAYAAVAELGCHILELPYASTSTPDQASGGPSLSMIIALPRKGLDLVEAIAKIYQYGMNKIYKELYSSKVEYEDEEVEVHLPRFEISTSLDMKNILETFGLLEIFDQSVADLSNINPNYFVSSMIHKTKISVDEKGTAAAAVTTSILANKATPPKFHANKPFLFFIVDRATRLILFSGQYVSPELF